MLRLRVLLACALAAAGAAAAASTPGRVTHAVLTAMGWWPYALVLLCLVNIVRLTVPPGGLYGPALLGAVALSALVGLRLTLRQWFVAGPLIVAGVGLLLGMTVPSSPPDRRTWALAWVVRRQLSGTLPARMAVLVLLGSAEVDLTAAVCTSKVECNVTMGMARLKLVVPAALFVELESAATGGIRILESGTAATGDPSRPKLVVHLLGLFGVVELHRV